MKLAIRQRGVLYLLIAIPVASLLMGVVTLYVAFSHRDPVVQLDEQPLTRTSWQEAPVPDDDR